MKKSEYYINNNENIIYHCENEIFAKNKPSDRIYSNVEEIKNLIFLEDCTVLDTYFSLISGKAKIISQSLFFTNVIKYA